MRIPCSAPLPTPTIMAVGVAKPKAQGHAITNIPTNANKPYETAVVIPRKYDPTTSQLIRVISAITRTEGINIDERFSKFQEEAREFNKL